LRVVCRREWQHDLGSREPADTGGAYTLIEGHHIAGMGPPLHTHDAEDETFWIVDGSYVIQADDE
jgi:hypothetical protein